MFALFRPAASLLAVFTVLVGLLYPLAITGLAQWLFPSQADGSLIRSGERVSGSALIGQPFADPGYFWGRRSATAPHPYNAGASAASNLGPFNPALHAAVKARIAALRAADPGNSAPVPADLVTASGSGLDPDISPAAAYYQVPRVARARGIPEAKVRHLVDTHAEGRWLGVLGEPHVNVLRLNLDLRDL